MDMPAYRTGQIRVCSASHPNKRRQMARAIPEVTTPITIFADDDVTWPVTILSWILAPFERDDTGGVVTCQRLRRPETFETLTQRLFYFLGAIYLERRNFDCAATNQMDGGMPCLSGRTVAYRTKILKDDCFTNGFTNETWLWNTSVKADDDNFISRWMVTHRWKTYIQYHHECEVQTTLEDNWKFLAQCLRWARSNWRSNLKSLFVERHVWRFVISYTTSPASQIIADIFSNRRSSFLLPCSTMWLTMSNECLGGILTVLTLSSLPRCRLLLLLWTVYSYFAYNVP